MQQLTAREWIELIADPEIREKALANVKLHPRDPDEKAINITKAIVYGFWWYETNEGADFWINLADNPPALLPIPNKEREAAEAVLKEFEAYLNKNAGFALTARIDIHITDFLNQKYPTNG